MACLAVMIRCEKGEISGHFEVRWQVLLAGSPSMGIQARGVGDGTAENDPAPLIRPLTHQETNPSMRGRLSSEAVQILCRRAPAHPLRRRLRSIWPISDLSADDSVCTPRHIL